MSQDARVRAAERTELAVRQALAACYLSRRERIGPHGELYADLRRGAVHRWGATGSSRADALVDVVACLQAWVESVDALDAELARAGRPRLAPDMCVSRCDRGDTNRCSLALEHAGSHYCAACVQRDAEEREIQGRRWY